MRGWLLAAALLASAVAIFFVRPHSTPGPPMRDFEAYDAAGTVWNAGGDPYSQTIWTAEKRLDGVNGARYEALPFVAPPALLPVFGLIAKLPFAAANIAWRCLLAASVAALLFLTIRIARLAPTAQTFAAMLAAALGFGPLTSALALGQLALPAMAFSALAVLAPKASFAGWIQPNIGLTVVSQASERRNAIAIAAGAAVFALLCVGVVGIGGLQHYVNVIHRHSLAERFSAIQITPAAVAYGSGAAAQWSSAIGVTIALAAACCWFALMRLAEDAAARFCATCALLPLAMPFFHEHDLLVLFVPALVYATRCTPRVWPLAAFGAILAGTDWLGLAQRPDATVQTLLLAGAFGCALVALREDAAPRLLLVPAGALALIAVAAACAHLHPAPIWPDAMGPLARNAGALDIASAWNAEQRATGLFAQQPLWAALRLLSLLGCAMTAGAIALSSRSPADSKSPLPVPAASF